MRLLSTALYLGLAALAAGCRGRSARGTTERFIEAIDARDGAGAVSFQVSGAQLARLVSCATANADNSWLSPEARAASVESRRATYAGVDWSKRVHLGPLFEEYDKASQWKSFRAGDVVYGDCRAKASFSREVYRIVLVITQYGRTTQSTKPIELWKIDGAYFVWDDPMETEGWH